MQGKSPLLGNSSRMKPYSLNSLLKKRPGRRLSLVVGIPLAAALVALAVVLPLCLPVAEAVGFSDVPETHPYHVQIETLAQLGIVSGYADGTFVPSAPVTRQEYVTMVCKATGKSPEAVEVYGLASGATLTVAQVIAIGTGAAGRALPLPPDYYVCTWGAFDSIYAPAVRLAEYNRFLRGLAPSERDLKSILPGQPASRGHAAAFLFNIMGTDPDGMCGRFLGDASDLVAYFRSKTGGNDGKFTVSLGTLARYYIIYGDRFGIRADMAWAQMIHETGWGQYGGDVKAWQNNMAGIGATGGVPGNSWSTAELGVIAQYAHLAWYVYPQDVSDPYCVKTAQPATGPITVPGDPRHFVQTGGATHKANVATVYDLGGQWAYPGTYYGPALQGLSAAMNVMCDAAKKGILHR
jgi:hypothetical protein